MEELIQDAVGNAALVDLNNKFLLELVRQYKGTGQGLTRRHSPGENDWELVEQQTLFKLLPAQTIEVYLNKYHMMVPVKSLSFVYGITTDGIFSRDGHDCSKCNNSKCLFRQEKKNHVITVRNKTSETDLEASHGTNLFKFLTSSGYPIYNSCGGQESCGKCIVHVEGCGSPSEREVEILARKKAPSGSRLSCYVDITDNLEVVIPDEPEEAQIMTMGHWVSDEINYDPRVHERRVVLSEPSLHDQRDHLQRLQEALAGLNKIDLSILSKLPGLIREKSSDLNVVIWDDEIVHINSGSDNKACFGLAVDIGTTTMAAYLLDFTRGEIKDTYASLNPQKIYGADVISRINYTVTEPNGLEEIRDVIIAELNRMVEYFCETANIKSRDIYEIVAVGNTTMIHFLLGLDCREMTTSPFIPVFTGERILLAREAGLHIHPRGRLITLPAKSAYVGADTIAAILAVGMEKETSYNLLIDIGTNGEIVLGNKDKMLCCSTAAGPAFEGGGISWGMGGVKGAIDHVNFKWKHVFTTIGNESPLGICGSGIVDLIAELLRCGIVNVKGRMKKPKEFGENDFPQLTTDEKGGVVFTLHEPTGISISQKDIREIQLAKGAIYAGVQLLMKQLGIKEEDIKKVYLAGGFGNYLNLHSANAIKLLPPRLIGKCIFVGNAAGTGAVMALKSRNVSAGR